MVLAIASGGAGHGHYVFARLLFPLPILAARFTGGSITLPLILAAFAQFPLYGYMIDWSVSTKRYLWSIVIVAVHLIAVGACFGGAVPNFS